MLNIILDDLDQNPRCQHGPTILFHRTDASGNTQEKYYACSASRDGRCSFRIDVNSNSKYPETVEPGFKQSEEDNQFEKVRNAAASQKIYCIKCQRLLLRSESQTHYHHQLLCNLSEQILQQPTRFLTPLSGDGNEAQYFFSGRTLNCLVSLFNQLSLTNVLCIGAPRLHEHLLSKTSMDSLLLDIDIRCRWFYDESRFLQYNMFNHYFFEGQFAEKVFARFISNAGLTKRICIFTDPPFGCRTELLAHTIRKINDVYNTINSSSREILPTFWVFPYFMETYIRNELPSMEMMDYQVDYTNHKAYHNGEKGAKYGSPARIFTNVPLESFVLHSDDYRHCPKCGKSVHISNKHCSVCKKCTSKNGSTYKHCFKCNWCVKPSYKHCNKCGRCTQVQDHECSSYQKHVTCRICLVKGHVELSCSYWRIYGGNKRRTGCITCGSKKHIVSDCKERKMRLQETYFLGRYSNAINEKE